MKIFDGMKQYSLTAGAARICGLAILMLSAMNCTNDKGKKAYIGPSDIMVEDGKMTPEVLLSLGRLSDPQLSPDDTLRSELHFRSREPQLPQSLHFQS